MKQHNCLRNSTTFITVLEYIGGHREQNYGKVIFVVIFCRRVVVARSRVMGVTTANPGDCPLQAFNGPTSC